MVVADSLCSLSPAHFSYSEPEPVQQIRPSYLNAGLAALARQAGPSLVLPTPSSAVKAEPSELTLPIPKARPPPKPKTITDIFPDFKHGQVLDFVDMFACGVAAGKGKKQIKSSQRGGDKSWDLTSGQCQSCSYPLSVAETDMTRTRVLCSGDLVSAACRGALARCSSAVLSPSPAKRRSGPVKIPARGLRLGREC